MARSAASALTRAASKPLADLGNAVIARIGTLGVEQDLLDRIQANLLRLQQIVGDPAGAHP